MDFAGFSFLQRNKTKMLMTFSKISSVTISKTIDETINRGLVKGTTGILNSGIKSPSGNQNQTIKLTKDNQASDPKSSGKKTGCCK